MIRRLQGEKYLFWTEAVFTEKYALKEDKRTHQEGDNTLFLGKMIFHKVI